MSEKWDRSIWIEGPVSEVSDTRVLIEGWSMPREMFGDPAVGDRYAVQTVRGSTPSAVYRCVRYKSDAELDADHEQVMAGILADHTRRLEAHAEEWRIREERLPAPLQARLANFRARGTDFDLHGWGYELVVAELAQLYATQLREHGGIVDETEEIEEYARDQGTSGNQHDFAKQLAKLLYESPELVANTISALTPLGTGPYYETAWPDNKGK